jgi:glucose-6-phosphate dehydrogenase assembly protein OpcA
MSSAIVFPAQPENILKALGKVWTTLGAEEKLHGAPTVLRACAMTLIVATDEADGGFSASQTISELMHEHPSRGVVLAVADDLEHGIEARVLAQCWKPFGKAQQICCEQIEIRVRPDSWPNVGPTLVGLTAPDLPVVFWCRHSAALSPSATRKQIAGIDAVMRLASKAIIDTKGQDLETSIDLIGQWRTRGRVIADLEWARITPWRQPIAQVFDNATREVPFSDFRSFEIQYSDENLSAQALYMAAWLSAFSRGRVQFTRIEGHGPGIHKVTLKSEAETITFERTGPDCMTLSSTNGRERRYSYTDLPLHSLLNEELAIVGPDPAFDTTFERARELANG